MDPNSSRVRYFSPRIAAAILAIVVLTSCNPSTPASTSNEGSSTGDPYATRQQAVEGENEGQAPGAESGGYYIDCPLGEKWYVCVDVNLTTTWPDPHGHITYSVKPGTIPCADVLVINFQDYEWGEVIDIDISGESEDDNAKLTWKGQTTLIIKGTARCENLTSGTEHLVITQKWGNASARLTCTPKRDGYNCMPETRIPLGTLGDQTIPLSLLIMTGNVGQCQTFPISGPLSVEISYCLTSLPSVKPSPLVP